MLTQPVVFVLIQLGGQQREPLPFSTSAPGCAFSVHVRAGQWGGCEGQPSITGVWASAQNAARSELTDRRARWAAALAGKEWRPPRPMEPERPTRRP